MKAVLSSKILYAKKTNFRMKKLCTQPRYLTRLTATRKWLIVGYSAYRFLNVSAESLLPWASWVIEIVCPELILVTNEYHIQRKPCDINSVKMFNLKKSVLCLMRNRAESDEFSMCACCVQCYYGLHQNKNNNFCK